VLTRRVCGWQCVNIICIYMYIYRRSIVPAFKLLTRRVCGWQSTTQEKVQTRQILAFKKRLRSIFDNIDTDGTHCYLR